MSALVKGQVISHLGQGIAVEISTDQLLLCQTRRKLETVAVGDWVMVSNISATQGRIEEILPRRSVLTRPSRNQPSRPVAANIDKIFVIFAVEPACDFLLIDQYLVIGENNNINVELVVNKIDLDYRQLLKQGLSDYQQLGYRVHLVSATQNLGFRSFKQALVNQVSLFAGQSGVGKSSLTNIFVPDKQLKTNSISEITRHGRHTTTAATLYHLVDGGHLIDTPGVAIFGLADLSKQQLAWGYREFQALIDQCQFNDCSHVTDQGCAITKAVECNTISKRRYQRFLKLRQKMS